jgi:PHS family inorganic phosphate transporter-like MFS transporter
MEYLICAVQVAFYGLGLNSAKILTSPLLVLAGIGDKIDPSQLSTSFGIYMTLRNVAVGGLVVSVAGFLPGYYVTLLLIDIVGRKPIQYLGFLMLTILLAILGKMVVHLKYLMKLIEMPK